MIRLLLIPLALVGLSGCVAYAPYAYEGRYGYSEPVVVVQPGIYVQPGIVTVQPHHRHRPPPRLHGHPRRDLDRDGVPNRYDRDRDGDGIPDRYDRRPNTPRGR